MENHRHDLIPGFEAPVHRALTEPILLGGAPRAVAILNGTLAAAIGLGLRLWIAGAADLAGRPSGGGVGRQARPALRRRGAAAPSLSRASRRVREAAHDEPRRIPPQPQRLADFLPWAALVDRGVILNKDGSLPAHRPLSRSRSRLGDASRARRHQRRGSTMRCGGSGSGWAIFVEAQRDPGQPLSRQPFPDPASGLVDAERRAQFEEEGAHFESRYFLTFLYLPPPDDARARRGLAL